jgi:hypothetical protein
MRVVKFFSLLTLDRLVDFRGGQTANLVSHILDLGPGEAERRPRFTVLFLADELRQLLKFREHGRRIPTPTSFNFWRHT